MQQWVCNIEDASYGAPFSMVKAWFINGMPLILNRLIILKATPWVMLKKTGPITFFDNPVTYTIRYLSRTE